MAQRRELPEKEIRQAIAALPDVGSCKIEVGPDGTISAIHIVSRTKRAAKQIVRDIESVLQADFGVRVDHRKVSIARLEPKADRKPGGEGGRARVVSMRLSAAGGKGRCEVVLDRDGFEVTGEADGVVAGAGRLRLIARATLSALAQLVEEEAEFDLLDIVRLRTGDRGAVAVLASFVSGRDVRNLAGCVQFDDDEQQAAVLAALHACNRIIEMSARTEPTEYEVTPDDEA